MRLTAITLVLTLCLHSISHAAEPQVIKLWPGKAPGETEEIGPEKQLPLKKGEDPPIIRLTNVSQPIISIYRPESKKSDVAVIVAPGGGYNILAYNHEGSEVCQWLNSIGVTAVLLKYRVPRRSQTAPHEIPLKDAQRAIRLVRSKASELEINPKRIGFLGFSAGGNLTVMTGTHHRDNTYEAVDDADKLSARPDFMVPIYPAYLLDGEDKSKLSPLITVDSETPPTFMSISFNDKDRAVGTALLLVALQQNKVPCELHVFHTGGHGYGIRPRGGPFANWPDRLHDWMVSMGYLKE